MEKIELYKEVEILISHIMQNHKKQMPLIFWIDLFCGAGGTSSGIHFSETNSFVIACVNHDTNAILSHKENHPNSLHFIEDIRDFNVVIKLKYLVEKLREKFPSCIISMWASLECTNFSKAKGGLPRDADSRTLADHMFMYLEELKPDYFWVENVREFMSWGPLDEKGKPVSRTSGQYFTKWIDNVLSYGYKYDKKLLNSADYGAYQSRERLFIQFCKQDFPIAWPNQTHAKKVDKESLFPIKKWKPVKEVLDLSDEGNSIFERKKPLSENTLKRIYSGLIKFVANGENIFSNNTHTLISKTHLNTYYGNGGISSIEKPCPTITTKDRVAKIAVNFIDQQYGNSKPSSIDNPCNTITTSPKFNLVTPWLMDTNFNNIGRSIEEPSQTIMACRKHRYLVNPQYNSKGKSIDEPCFTLIARMDKRPPSVVTIKEGNYHINIFPEDSQTTILIKQFMAAYGIIDIKMRMLKIPELKQIQGFPKDYKLVGTQTEQKKYIGNAVEVNQAKAIVSANYKAIRK